VTDYQAAIDNPLIVFRGIVALLGEEDAGNEATPVAGVSSMKEADADRSGVWGSSSRRRQLMKLA